MRQPYVARDRAQHGTAKRRRLRPSFRHPHARERQSLAPTGCGARTFAVAWTMTLHGGRGVAAAVALVIGGAYALLVLALGLWAVAFATDPGWFGIKFVEDVTPPPETIQWFSFWLGVVLAVMGTAMLV